jgi:catechol 2,3-dioxygenase-like lactoylglutathione lyase family enzyme
MPPSFTVVGLGYISLYYRDFDEAVSFYTRVFGAPLDVDGSGKTLGWRLSATWLTLFPSSAGTCPGANPCNSEFAVQVSAPEEVDALAQNLVDAGARLGKAPEDTWMYERMRFAYVDDPFGVRIDIFCPLPDTDV